MRETVHIPYFSQWESAEFAPAILDKTFDLRDDPRWENSGASSREEYAHWANHVCGMACLKMVLAAKRGKIYPTLMLARMATHYGAYRVDAQEIKGMIYAPVITLLAEKFQLSAQVMRDLPAAEIVHHLSDQTLFMASVHPSIRWPSQMPPSTGGHLILVTAASDDHIRFHNPSGDTVNSRENVSLTTTAFARYYAQRGILIE